MTTHTAERVVHALTLEDSPTIMPCIVLIRYAADEEARITEVKLLHARSLDWGEDVTDIVQQHWHVISGELANLARQYEVIRRKYENSGR